MQNAYEQLRNRILAERGAVAQPYNAPLGLAPSRASSGGILGNLLNNVHGAMPDLGGEHALMAGDGFSGPAGGFLQGLGPKLADFSIGFSMGRTPNERMAYGTQAVYGGLATRKQEHRQQAELNRTRQAAKAMGIPAEIADNAPMDVLTKVISEAYLVGMKPQDPIATDKPIYDPQSGQWITPPGYSAAVPDAKLITLSPPSGSDLKPRSFDLSNPKQRQLATDYIDRGWVESSAAKPQKMDFVMLAPPPGTNLPSRTFDTSSERNHAVIADYLNRGWTQVPSSAASVTINQGGESSLRKKLSEKEGEGWAAYLDSASVSGSTLQDLGALDELLKSAPQGPIAGRLAEAFPGFSTAGDAAQSIMMRVAPTLRTPGSGSTSDIEYEGLLKSLPRLSNSPGGNQIISGVMRAKAQLNVERGQIVSAYQNDEITDSEARKRLQELNRRSIMTPELRAIIDPDSKLESGGYSLDEIERELKRREGK